jgi:hypothetical protein
MPNNWDLVSVDSLGWATDARLHIGFRDGGGGPGFFVDAAVPADGTAPCDAGERQLLLQDNEIPGVTTRLSTAFRWFLGEDRNRSLLYVDGTLQLLIARQADSVITARSAQFKNAQEATQAAAFLPTMLGLHLEPWPPERSGACPGTICWGATDGQAYRFLVQRDAFLVWVNAYALASWDYGMQEHGHPDRTALAINVAEAILVNSSARGGS